MGTHIARRSDRPRPGPAATTSAAGSGRLPAASAPNGLGRRPAQRQQQPLPTEDAMTIRLIRNCAALSLLPLLLPGTPAYGQTRTAAAPSLNDPQIAHVAVTANAIDIELAQLALSRARRRRRSGRSPRRWSRTTR